MITESERVYDQIVQLIKEDFFTPGQALRESAIASKLHVSRTPVREALRRLATEGTVELTPNRGATLVDYSETDVSDIWALRALLEPYAARLAAERASTENIERLEALFNEMQASVEKGDLDSLTDLNNNFHAEIVDASGSRILRDALALVRKKPLVRRTFGHYSSAQLQRSQQHHRDLVDAIKAQKAQWAESTMRAHIEAGQETA